MPNTNYENLNCESIAEQYLLGRRDFQNIITQPKEYLTNKNLTGIDWRGSILPNIVFRRSDMSHSNFEGLDLSNSGNGGASFVDSNLKNAIIDFATFGSTNLKGVIFENTYCNGAMFYESTLLPNNTRCNIRELRRLIENGSLNILKGLPLFENEIITI
jgi:uncharacterized protein YjbI with pentapeptide repeats